MWDPTLKNDLNFQLLRNTREQLPANQVSEYLKPLVLTIVDLFVKWLLTPFIMNDNSSCVLDPKLDPKAKPRFTKTKKRFKFCYFHLRFRGKKSYFRGSRKKTNHYSWMKSLNLFPPYVFIFIMIYAIVFVMCW